MKRHADVTVPVADGVDEKALTRFQLLCPVLESDISIPAAARASGVPAPTLRRWLRLYRQHGLSGFARRSRRDRGQRRQTSAELAAITEGLALQRPRRSVVAIHRIVRDIAAREGKNAPSYATVQAIIRAIDPALMVLAHEGTKAYAHGFELPHRREATRPNEIWQADHT